MLRAKVFPLGKLSETLSLEYFVDFSLFGLVYVGKLARSPIFPK